MNMVPAAESELAVAWLGSDFRDGREQLEQASQFIAATRGVCKSRRIIVTKSGLIGIGPNQLQIGDSVCMIASAAAPLMLWSYGDRWLVLGEVYILGLAEAFDIGIVRSSDRPLDIEAYERCVHSALGRLIAACGGEESKESPFDSVTAHDIFPDSSKKALQCTILSVNMSCDFSCVAKSESRTLMQRR